eukprot:scpid72641/ scgid33075/ 
MGSWQDQERSPMSPYLNEILRLGDAELVEKVLEQPDSMLVETLLGWREQSRQARRLDWLINPTMFTWVAKLVERCEHIQRSAVPDVEKALDKTCSQAITSVERLAQVAVKKKQQEVVQERQKRQQERRQQEGKRSSELKQRTEVKTSQVLQSEEQGIPMAMSVEFNKNDEHMSREVPETAHSKENIQPSQTLPTLRDRLDYTRIRQLAAWPAAYRPPDQSQPPLVRPFRYPARLLTSISQPLVYTPFIEQTRTLNTCALTHRLYKKPKSKTGKADTERTKERKQKSRVVCSTRRTSGADNKKPATASRRRKFEKPDSSSSSEPGSDSESGLHSSNSNSNSKQATTKQWKTGGQDKTSTQRAVCRMTDSAHSRVLRAPSRLSKTEEGTQSPRSFDKDESDDNALERPSVIVGYNFVETQCRASEHTPKQQREVVEDVTTSSEHEVPPTASKPVAKQKRRSVYNAFTTFCKRTLSRMHSDTGTDSSSSHDPEQQQEASQSDSAAQAASSPSRRTSRLRNSITKVRELSHVGSTGMLPYMGKSHQYTRNISSSSSACSSAEAATFATDGKRRKQRKPKRGRWRGLHHSVHRSKRPAFTGHNAQSHGNGLAEKSMEETELESHKQRHTGATEAEQQRRMIGSEHKQARATERKTKGRSTATHDDDELSDQQPGGSVHAISVRPTSDTHEPITNAADHTDATAHQIRQPRTPTKPAQTTPAPTPIRKRHARVKRCVARERSKELQRTYEQLQSETDHSSGCDSTQQIS